MNTNIITTTNHLCIPCLGDLFNCKREPTVRRKGVKWNMWKGLTWDEVIMQIFDEVTKRMSNPVMIACQYKKVVMFGTSEFIARSPFVDVVRRSFDLWKGFAFWHYRADIHHVCSVPSELKQFSQNERPANNDNNRRWTKLTTDDKRTTGASQEHDFFLVGCMELLRNAMLRIFTRRTNTRKCQSRKGKAIQL